MKKQLFAAAFAALMTGVPYAAYAQEAPPPGGHAGGGMGMMMHADTNHDGVLTREEMLADVDQRFAAMDTNHDNKVSAEERAAAPGGGMRGGRGGGDGDMTLDQMHAQATRRFDMVDANHDGKIDQAEIDAMRQRMMNRRNEQPADAPSSPNGN
jgi:hypothetical protein